ncbi:hypothetical protein ACQ4LE_011034 [Meloidogyne hapla]
MLEKLEENYALRTEASHAILVAKIDASHSILQAKIEASNWVSTFKNGLFFSFLGIGLKIVWDKYNEYKDNQAIQEIEPGNRQPGHREIMDELVKIEKIVSNGSEKDNRTKNSNNGAKAGVLKIPPDSNAERVVTNNDKCE